MPFQRHAAEMVATHSQQSAIVYIGVGMGILSMVTTFLAFLTYLAILNYDRYLVNRLSFRLTALVCAVDFIYSFFQGLGHSRIVGTGAACRFFGWGYTNFGLISVIVRSTMAFNLMQLVIFRRASFARHERLFWLGTISFALAASLVPLCAGALGLSVPSGDCWYRRETEEGGQAWKWTTYYGWVLLCIIYSTISVVVIAITVRRRINRPELVPATSSSHFNPLHRLSHLSIYSITSVLRRLSLRHTRRHGGWDDRGEGSTSDAVLAPPNSPVAANSELSRAINATHNRPTNVLYKLILRVMWYPLIPAICQTLDVIENIVGLTTRRIYMPLYIISLVLVGMQGFLTAFVFFTDPVIVHAWTLFKCDLVVVFFFDYEWGMFRAANDWRIPPSQRNQSSVSRPSGSHSSTSNQPPFRRAGQMASDRVEVHHHRRSLFDDGFSLKHRKMLSYPFTLPPQRRAVGARLVPAPTRVTTSPNSRSRFATLPSLRHIHNVSDPLPRDSSRPHHPVAYPHLYRQSGRAWDPANPCYSHASSGSADQQSVLGGYRRTDVGHGLAYARGHPIHRSTVDLSPQPTPLAPQGSPLARSPKSSIPWAFTASPSPTFLPANIGPLPRTASDGLSSSRPLPRTSGPLSGSTSTVVTSLPAVQRSMPSRPWSQHRAKSLDICEDISGLGPVTKPSQASYLMLQSDLPDASTHRTSHVLSQRSAPADGRYQGYFQPTTRHEKSQGSTATAPAAISYTSCAFNRVYHDTDLLPKLANIPTNELSGPESHWPPSPSIAPVRRTPALSVGHHNMADSEELRHRLESYNLASNDSSPIPESAPLPTDTGTGGLHSGRTGPRNPKPSLHHRLQSQLLSKWHWPGQTASPHESNPTDQELDLGSEALPRPRLRQHPLASLRSQRRTTHWREPRIFPGRRRHHPPTSAAGTQCRLNSPRLPVPPPPTAANSPLPLNNSTAAAASPVTVNPCLHMSTQEKYAHSVWFSTCLGRYRNWRRRAQEIRVRRWCTLRYPGTNVDQPLTAISRNPPFKIPSPPLSSAQAANNPTAATVPDLETKSWPALFTRYLRHRREMVHYHVTYWVVSIIHWVVKRYLVSDDELLELDYILDRIPFQPGEPIGDRLPYFEAQASREHCEQPANLYHWDFPENQT